MRKNDSGAYASNNPDNDLEVELGLLFEFLLADFNN